MKRSGSISLWAAFAGLILLLTGWAIAPVEKTVSPWLVLAGMVVAGTYWFWSLLAILESTTLSSTQKFGWIVIATLLPVFGGITYQLTARDAATTRTQPSHVLRR